MVECDQKSARNKLKLLQNCVIATDTILSLSLVFRL